MATFPELLWWSSCLSSASQQAHFLLSVTEHTMSLSGSHLFSPPPSLERQMFLATWKDIPNENEAQFQIRECPLNAGRTPEHPPTPSTLPFACTQSLPCH